MTSRVAAAVERALDLRQREATEEVERILDAALIVMERVAPAPPRVSDIVAEAGTSNAAFYRYFGGKDDLILAVMERGVGLVVSYLEHEMAKEASPLEQVARWIEGTLAQIVDPHLASMSRATITQFTALADTELTEPLRQLVSAPIAEAGCANPQMAADTVYAAVMGALRRHVAEASQPQPAEIDYLVSFCLKAIDPDVPPSKVAIRRGAKPVRRSRKAKG